MHRLTLKTAPAALAVEERLVREHLSVDTFTDSYLIESYIRAATAYLDGWTGLLGMALMPQSWVMTLDTFPAGSICVPLGPVTSIVGVTYKDATGAVQTLAPADYEVSTQKDGAELRAVTSWPAVGDYLDPVEVEFVAGSGCPEPVRIAIMMMVSSIYDGRHGDDMLTPAVRALIAPYRRPHV
jgi:uncharacterized phiE125 gp8 family phage protein